MAAKYTVSRRHVVQTDRAEDIVGTLNPQGVVQLNQDGQCIVFPGSALQEMLKMLSAITDEYTSSL